MNNNIKHIALFVILVLSTLIMGSLVSAVQCNIGQYTIEQTLFATVCTEDNTDPNNIWYLCQQAAPVQRCVQNPDSTLELKICKEGTRCGEYVPPATCTDTIQNQGETAIDCGGPNCDACADGLTCELNSDCASNSCISNVCQAQASCTDGQQDPGETAIDCGGPNCAACGIGLACVLNTDCTSGSCVGNVCETPAEDITHSLLMHLEESAGPIADASTNDHVGTPTGSGFTYGQQGIFGNAIMFENAVGGIVIPNHPSLQFQAGDSFTISCWIKTLDSSGRHGGHCVQSIGTLGYILGIDWQTGKMKFFRKSATSWTEQTSSTIVNDDQWHHLAVVRDMTKNTISYYVDGTPDILYLWGEYYTEQPIFITGSIDSNTNIKIGAEGFTKSVVDEVSVWKRVLSAQEINALYTQQATAAIANGVSIPAASATCTDGIKNRKETDIDCGGPDCPKCVDSKTCERKIDCEFNSCVGNICQAQGSCSDGLLNVFETDIDCGKSCAEIYGQQCAVGQTCEVNSDCTSLTCDQATNTCTASSGPCFNGIKDGDETGIDCGGTCAQTLNLKCSDTQRCTVDDDCQSAACIGTICQGACTPGKYYGIDCTAGICADLVYCFQSWSYQSIIT